MMLHHETITLERTFKASPLRVFAAYQDTKAREKWSAPEAGVEVEILDCDFRAGGVEHARCGANGDMQFGLTLNYHAVEESQLIVYSEELRDGQMMLTVALISMEISENESGGTTLLVTDQVTSFVGEEGAAGHKQAYLQALENLAEAIE